MTVIKNMALGRHATARIPLLPSIPPAQARNADGPGRTSRRRTRRLWGVTMAIVAVALLLNLPLLNAINVSFKPDAQINSPLSLPDAPTLAHYANALGASGYNFPAFFANSLQISLGSVLLVLIIAVPGCYAGIRLHVLRGYLVTGMVGLRLLPAIFFSVPIYVLFMATGVLDTVFGLVVANTLLNLPLAIVLLSAGMNDVPREIEEAAVLDGASVYRVLRSVVVPILAPTLVAVAVLTFVFSWNEYLFGVTLSSTRATPITVGAANFVTSYGVQWGDLSALTVLSSIIPLAFAIFAQRYLVSGMTVGAVKG